MRSIIRNARRVSTTGQPTTFNTMRQNGQLTIMLVDPSELEVPGLIDRKQNVLWVQSDLSDDDIAWVVDKGMRRMLRPELEDVSAGAPSGDALPALQPTVKPASTVPTERPALRLVTSRSSSAGCLSGCEYNAERATESDGHLCSVSVGESPVTLINARQQARVSMDRYEDGIGGADPAFVSIGQIIDGQAHDPQEMTPAAARALAAQLIAAAKLAEQADAEQKRSRQTA